MFNPSWLTPYDANGKEYDGEIPGTGLISLRHREANVKDASRRTSITTLGYLQFTPIEGLILRTQGGVEGYYALHPVRYLPSYVENLKNGAARESLAALRVLFLLAGE